MSIPIIDYLVLCKPKVVGLMIMTMWIGMHLATTNTVSISLIVFTSIGIYCCASSAAVLNHLLDRHIDAKMLRTQNRPLPQRKISIQNAITFSIILGTVGLWLLWAKVNTLTAILTAMSLMGYAFFYTLFLKRATPQNIVIGGLAGAMPPLLGSTAITNAITSEALILVLIIFTWTPPHFWALAIYRQEDYRKANIPMLPVTHGLEFTTLYILLYSILLSIVTFLPYLIQMVGFLYLIPTMICNSIFCYKAYRLHVNFSMRDSFKLFKFSVTYLLIVFIALLIDHYFGFLLSPQKEMYVNIIQN